MMAVAPDILLANLEYETREYLKTLAEAPGKSLPD
jgi:hypothetical protein